MFDVVQDPAQTKMKTELLRQCNVCDSAELEVIDAECNLVRCQSCGYIFDSPRPTLEELIAFYSRPTQYDSWLTQLEARDRLWRRRLRRLESTRKPGSLLDVGTGIGQFLFLARNLYTEVYGTEVSSTAIKIAREKFNLNLFQGTIEELDVPDRLFDNITLFHVLEHVPDPRSVLKTCHSLLSTQGVIVVGVPNEVTSLRVSMKRMLVKAGVKKQSHVGKFGLPRISLSS
jgi:2-polyprenyl-3-methyl-5-hydroxy-6-metoxy-1,4-benzoquinol methylase